MVFLISTNLGEEPIKSLEELNNSLTNIPIPEPILNDGEIHFCNFYFTFYEIREIEPNNFEIVSYQTKYFFNRFNFENFETTFIYTDIIEELNFILTDKYKTINSQNITNSNDTNIKANEETENKKQTFNVNHFNQKGYELFLYLVENYEKEGKVKYNNIFKFMKNEIDKKKYVFRFFQKDFKVFLISNYNVEIKKFQVAQFQYEDTEIGILNSLERQFDGR
ncbi:two-component SAPR family response regulator [Flavobacterium sp. 7A]|nr:two-component SAPR family response regulator [Flavobacterium sp. 7A]